MLPLVAPMPLASVKEPFDDRDWIFEPKWDEELAHAVQCQSAVLDGEIVCLEQDGRSHFYNLLFRRDWPLGEQRPRFVDVPLAGR